MKKETNAKKAITYLVEDDVRVNEEVILEKGDRIRVLKEQKQELLTQQELDTFFEFWITHFLTNRHLVDELRPIIDRKAFDSKVLKYLENESKRHNDALTIQASDMKGNDLCGKAYVLGLIAFFKMISIPGKDSEFKKLKSNFLSRADIPNYMDIKDVRRNYTAGKKYGQSLAFALQDFEQEAITRLS